MSASLNEVRLLGNLGTDPEYKNLAGDKAVATFRLATNKEWTDGAGQKQSRTDWHTVEVWGGQANNVAKYLTKGRQVLVGGELRYDEWEKDGQKRVRAKVVASRVVFLGGAPDVAVVAGEEPAEDEIPF
jgi:single-strand DNA-binding protein